MTRQLLLAALLLSSATAFVTPFAKSTFVGSSSTVQRTIAFAETTNEEKVEAAKANAEDAADSAKDTASDIGSQISDAVNQVGERISDAVESAQESVKSVIEDSSNTLESVQETAQDKAAQVASNVEDVAPTPERHTMFIGNIPFGATKEDIQELCAGYGTVVSVNLPTDRTTGSPRGFGFVDMSNAQELDAAVNAVDGHEILGRQIRANKSLSKDDLEKKRATQPQKPRTQKLYVGNLPFEATTDDLYDMFGEFGQVSDVFIPTREDGMSRGFGFVTMSEEGSTAALEQLNGVEYDGRQLVVNLPLSPGDKNKSTFNNNRRNNNNEEEDPNRVKLYIGNLSFYTSTETLREMFGEFGQVFDCYMPTDRSTGQTRGFGFVTMERAGVDRAIEELSGCEVDGRSIQVNEARPKNAGPPRGNDGFYSDNNESY